MHVLQCTMDACYPRQRANESCTSVKHMRSGRYAWRAERKKKMQSLKFQSGAFQDPSHQVQALQWVIHFLKCTYRTMRNRSPKCSSRKVPHSSKRVWCTATPAITLSAISLFFLFSMQELINIWTPDLAVHHTHKLKDIQLCKITPSEVLKAGFTQHGSAFECICRHHTLTDTQVRTQSSLFVPIQPSYRHMIFLWGPEAGKNLTHSAALLPRKWKYKVHQHININVSNSSPLRWRCVHQCTPQWSNTWYLLKHRKRPMVSPCWVNRE